MMGSNEVVICRNVEMHQLAWTGIAFERRWAYRERGEPPQKLSPQRLLNCDGLHFFVGGMSQQDLLDAILNERCHALFDGDFQHFFRPGLSLNQLLHPIRPLQEFVQRDTAFVP